MTDQTTKRRATLRRCRNFLVLGVSIGVPAALLTLASAQDKADAKEKITFQDHVFPIFEDACLNCHNPDKAKGGLDLSTYGAAMEGGSGGAVAEPGDPASSRILLGVLHREEPFMPPKKPMIDKANIEVLTKWIEGGLLDNPNSKPQKKSVPEFAMTLGDAPIGKPEGPPPMPENILLEPEVVTARATAVQDIATSPWAPLAALTGQNQVLLYNTDTHDLVGVLPFPEGFPESVAFSRNGSLVLAGGGLGGKSGKAVAWDVKTGRRVIEAGSEFDTVLAADISPDQSQVALGGPGRNVKVYDTKTGEELHNLKKHPDWLLELAYSPDGTFLASGGRSGGLYLWDPPKGIEFFTLKGHTQAITGLAWRDDSKVLASCSEDGQVILWETAEGKQLKKWSAGDGGTLSIHFDHAGNIVTSGRNKRVSTWAQDGKRLHSYTTFDDLVLNAAFSHDGKRVITADWTGAVTTWDAATDNKKIGALDSNPPLLASRLESLDNRKIALEKQIADAKKGHDGLVQKKAALEKQQTDLRGTVASLGTQKKAQEALVAKLKGDVPRLKKEHDQLVAAVAARQQAMTKALEQVKQAEQELASVQAELNTWRQRLDAEKKTKAAAFSTKPGWIVQVAANDSDPVVPAPAKKPAPAKSTPAPAPKPAPKATPAATPAPEPAKKPQPEVAKKPAPSKPAPAVKPESKKPAPAPAAKPKPPTPAPPTEAQKKVADLTQKLKMAEGEMKQARSAETEAKEAFQAQVASRDAKLKELKDFEAKLAAAEKAVPSLAAQIVKSQEQDKALTGTIAETVKTIPEAKKKLDASTAEAATLPKQRAFWKAAHFHVEVVKESALLEDMKLNFPETPGSAEKAALERQQLKVRALEQYYVSILPK